MIFKRHAEWPKERASTVERAWEGRIVVCVATGPSLTGEQLETIRAAAVPAIAVNDAYLAAPFASVAYFADSKWWKWHRSKPEWQAFAGEKCTIHAGSDTASDPEIHVLRNAKQAGLSTDPGSICTGSNSGYQAVNVATLAGARRVVMIGYDCRSIDGRDHYFGDHPDKSKPPYDVIRQRFREIVAPAKSIGVEIVNATPGSAIECFRRMDLAEALRG